MQDQQTQFKLLIKTSSSKLKFKLTKSRALSTHTIQTKILTELKDLAALPNDSRAFERGLDILKMDLATLVRSDRVADVWEDLIGELAILESSVHLLPGMIENQLKLQKEKAEKLKRAKSLEQQKQQQGGWSFFGFKFRSTEPVSIPTDDVDIDDASELVSEPIDRLSKVIRNVVIAQEFLGDDIKELKKLAISLNHCIDKDNLLKFAPETNGTNEETSNLDLEDRIYIEIVRKLKGEDEENVVNEYLKELSSVYRIDLYNEGKYQEDDEGDDTELGTSNEGQEKVKKPLSELEELKQRFEALKKL
ncbi:hypothetical protein CANINC_001544 [Pichia inconspicua]|uniref:Uncharacterized protein n=1 Tax=Pichia inconspicua TaxID=52247 RepID=A0A4T0X3B9_9ASCO|nr:hypothetical protein CANINC_001544 [[Candida] inconspicua]